MKDKFIKRYKDKLHAYFSYGDIGEGHRAIMYVVSEYERILEEEFNMTHDEVRAIYDEMYANYFMEGKR